MGFRIPHIASTLALVKATGTVCVGGLWFSSPLKYITGQPHTAMSMLKLNRKNLHCSPQSPASFVFCPPSPIFSQNSWPLHKPTDSLQNTAVYLASVEMTQKSEKKSWNGQSGIENEEREREREREKQARLQRAESMQRPGLFFFPLSLFFFFFFSVSNDSQRKEKASSLSSVEPNISFLLERQEGNTQSSAHTHTRIHTEEGLD